MLAAGKEEIRDWFINGVANNYKYMLIVYDQMDDPDDCDSPYYANNAKEARYIFKKMDGDVFCKVMEVYDLTAGIDEQLSERRTWRLPLRVKGVGSNG